ncbi:hypothetical protein PILCRDRAFT_815069, partial [Piloderma croceum F 1598]
MGVLFNLSGDKVFMFCHSIPHSINVTLRCQQLHSREMVVGLRRASVACRYLQIYVCTTPVPQQIYSAPGPVYRIVS